MRLTTKIIRRIVKEAEKYKLEPIRYPSTRIIEIKNGRFKGLHYPLPGTKPRKNGKFRCFALVYSNRKKGVLIEDGTKN